MTCSTSMFASSGTARALSTVRSTSPRVISWLRLMAAIPWLVIALRWVPAIPTQALRGVTPATRPAASTDCLTDSMVRSRFTTTPLRNPSLGTVPSPMMSSTPSLAISPMTVQILVVPMSRPPMMRSSLIMFAHSPGIHRQAVPESAFDSGPLGFESRNAGRENDGPAHLYVKAIWRVAYHLGLRTAQKVKKPHGLLDARLAPAFHDGKFRSGFLSHPGQSHPVGRPGGSFGPDARFTFGDGDGDRVGPVPDHPRPQYPRV